MGEAMIALITLFVVLLGVAAVQIVHWLVARRWRRTAHLDFLVAEFGFDQVADRFLVDSRIVRYAGFHQGTSVRVEVGAGPLMTFVRVDYMFEREVSLGLRISSEHEEGMVTRFMRLREIQVGLHHFDSQFILLSRDEGRLRELLDHDIRRMLIALRGKVRDVRLNDQGLHLQTIGDIERQDFLQILDDGAQLATHAFRRAEQILEEEARKEEEQATPPAFTPLPGALQAVSSEDVPR